MQRFRQFTRARESLAAVRKTTRRLSRTAPWAASAVLLVSCAIAFLVPHIAHAQSDSASAATNTASNAGPIADASSTADSSGASDVSPIPFWRVPLDTVRVHGERLSRKKALARQSAFSDLIQVNDARAAGEDLGALLARSAGIGVTRLGGPGTPATVSIRGLAAGDVEIYVDRTPLRSATQGTVDLSSIDLSRVSAIEVYRSAPPSDVGGLVSSAVVRLVTDEGDRPGVSMRLTSGSHGTRELSELLSARMGRHALFASLSRSSTQNDFRFFSDNGTEYETADDAWRTWTNGDQLRQTLFGRWRTDLGKAASAAWSSEISRRDQGIPGSSRLPTQSVRLASETALHRFEIESGRRFSIARANVWGYQETTGRAYRDPDRELGMYGFPKELDQEQLRRAVGGHLQRTVSGGTLLPGAHHLELLGEFSDERLEQEPPEGRPREDLRRRRTRVWSIGDQWDAFTGRVRVSAFYRWDRSADNYTGVNPYRPFLAQPEHVTTARSPRVGCVMSLGKGHALKANYARQARFPTFTELFGSEGTIRPNAGLAPEEGWQADAGWTWESERGPFGLGLSAEQVFYTTRKKQMIVFVLVSDHETKPFNLDRIRIDGYELSVSADHLPGLRGLRILPAMEERIRAWLGASDAEQTASSDARLTLHLTWQDARDEGVSPVYHGKVLPYHPALQGQAILDLVQGRWTLGTTARYRSAVYWGRSNLPMFRAAAQWQQDLSLRCALLGSRLSAAVRVENVWNREMEDVRGYPLPGRSWFTELQWRPVP